MNLLNRMRALVFILVLSGTALVGGQAHAVPLVIPAGFDLFESFHESLALGSTVDFGLGPIPMTGLPTGPLGHSPDPIFLVPLPFTEEGLLAKHRVQDFRMRSGNIANVDTIVQRHAPANLPNVGDMDTIPIELVSLSLTSVAPVNIGGSFFDVFVTLDPVPSVGTMTLTRTGENSGTFDSFFDVFFELTLQDVSNPLNRQTIHGTDRVVATDVPFQAVPEPGTWILLGSGLAGLAYWRRRT